MENRQAQYARNSESSYWTEFYKTFDISNGSSLCEFIKDSAFIPNTILDIGCGQGRDSLTFAQTGKRVYGIDRSEEGISHSIEKVYAHNFDITPIFLACDVTDDEKLSEIIQDARDKSNDTNICFYTRFFLHSIPSDVQKSLLTTLSNNSRENDVFVTEFRTDKDIDTSRVFGDTHYRRYQNAADFSRDLYKNYGWDIVYETEQRGLSIYKEEDPYLYRAIATRVQKEV